MMTLAIAVLFVVLVFLGALAGHAIDREDRAEWDGIERRESMRRAGREVRR